MQVVARIDHVLNLPLDWDNLAREGHNPQPVLDYLQQVYSGARTRKRHTSIVGQIKFKKGSRALLFVTNNRHNILKVNDQELKPQKGTLVILEDESAVLEHTYSERLVIEYSL